MKEKIIFYNKISFLENSNGTVSVSESVSNGVA